MTEAENRPPTTERRASRVHSSIGSKLYLDSASADVTFIVGRNDDQCERVPAHKPLLTTTSEVFETMFNGSWKEQDEVRIVDVTASSFKEFLQFFYLDEVELTMENVKDVMNLGKKYGIDGCFDLCAEYLTTKLTDDNVCRGYELAIRFEHWELRKFCEMVISLNTKKVFQSPSFGECDGAVVREILILDALSCTEAELFEAVMTWIKTKSKQTELTKELVDEHLGSHFQEFRFGSMPFEDFSKLVPSYGKIFSSEEMQDINQMIASPEYESSYFSDNREKRSESVRAIWFHEFSYSDRALSKHLSSKPYFVKNTETAVFSTNKPVVVNGFTCADFYLHRSGRYGRSYFTLPTRITISECADPLEFDEENSVVLYTVETDLRRTISLPQPILLQIGSMYQIRCEQRVPDKSIVGLLCTGVLLTSEMKIEPDITIQFHDDPTVGDDVDMPRGLFQHFIFIKI